MKDDFFADSWNVYAAATVTRIGKRHSHPTGGVFIGGIQAIPVHADLDPVQGVGVDLLIRRADHNRGLQRHDRFVVFERTMEGNRFALCFDLEQKKSVAAIGMWYG